MAKDYVVIKGQANIIRNETAEGGNTAAEVGGAIYDVADKLEEVDGVLTTAIGTKLPSSSVVDDLASTSGAAPLSANQGRVLDETKADKTTQVVAGNGLTGGGALSGDVTVNVCNTDDSIVVGADGIKVDTQDSLTSTSTTKPLSAAQGKALQDNKAEKTRTITAGNGLTGGGDLTADRTININPADDSLVVTADNVKVNTNNTLTSTSTTQPLSANQGKVLNDKVVQVETNLNEAITALEQEQIQGGVYDVSSHNDGAVFESLSTLLGSANLSTIIPTSVRRGGMSIRFIQSSDNKYVQYRLTKSEWSINIEDWAIADESFYVENPEYIEAKTDSEGKLLSGRTPDGAAFENVGFSAPKVSIDGHTIDDVVDQEGRIEISTDANGKIISYRDVNGKIHEEVGIETNQLTLTKEGMEDFQQQLNDSGFLPNKSVSIREYDLPKFGYVNLISETFYLTAAGWSSYANDVELIQDYEDTNENAWNKVTIAHFYIKGTQTKLDFYAASKVTKVDSQYYVTSTLTEIIDPVTGDISYGVNENSVDVRQCVDAPPYKAWPVDNETEHYCLVEIDFGHYLNGTFPVGIKYQGSSTLQWRKKNFRFTFYKDNKYKKKNKIKIGEFVRLSGFNLKANWTDNTKIKELFMNILFMAIWENRGKCTSYPWESNDTPYSGATGMIKGFPIEVNVGGTFYGLDVFGLKKDGKNYLLDKDEDGMIEGGTRNDVGCWETAAPIDWEDELNDEEDWVIDNQTQSNYDALINFFAFINGTLEEEGVIVPFDKSTMPERMCMPAWIDYLICLQVFLMLDSTCRNVMLYTGSDKKKFYPFFYDLDASMKYYNPTMDIMIPNGSPDWQEGGCYAYDLSLWEHIKEEWWDEIVNRYHELRHNILSDEYIKAVYENILNNIPDEKYSKESQRWGLQVSKQNFYETINQLKVRFNWLDNEYYK